jgi:hypothetical protein
MKLISLVTYSLAMIGVLTCAETGLAQNVAGIVEQIHCRAELTQRSGHNSIHLDAKRDIGRFLFPGESVVCTSTGFLDLLVFGRAVKIDQPGVPYSIPYIRPSHLSDEEQMRQSALEAYFRRGGRERSSDESAGDSVSPQFFFIVLPVDHGGRLVVSMRNKTDEEIWRGEISNRSGILESVGAREAISRYQQSGGGFLAVLIKQDDKRQQIKYFVLSSDAERQLESALAAWDGEPSSLVRHIGRASVLSDSMLFEAAGREYEAALSEAPESKNVLQAAIKEYERSGDQNRANSLKARLRASPSH